MDNINLKTTYEPATIEDSKIYSEIYSAQSFELNTVNTTIEDIKNQLCISTATWGLSIYEKALGIPIDLTKPYDYRRSVIKSKSRGGGKLNNILIKTICDSFTNGDVDVKFDGQIKITFTSILGVPPNMEDLQNAINEIKPAQLICIYAFRYYLIEEIDNVMTLDGIESLTLDKFAF